MARWFGQRFAVPMTLAVALLGSVEAQQPSSPAAEAVTVFRNVRVFNGTAAALSAPTTVVVRGSVIATIGGNAPTPTGATVIEGGGRTLMPGLIDAHWHSAMASVPLPVLLSSDVGYINLVAAVSERDTLLRGFTSVRDVGGPTFGLKRAIDEGLVNGPRIWPAGAMISQSGGHGDFRMPYEVPAAANAPPSRGEAINGGMIADSPDEVRKRVREQLMLGASQIKLAAGGGVASPYDPIDVAQYTEAEFRAAVEAAENWGTYVTVHAYTPRAIQAAVRAGVKCIEHGQLMDDDTAKLMSEKGVWLSLQPFIDNEYANPQTGPSRAKQLEVFAGTDRAYALAKKYHLKTAWGTDILFDPKMVVHQGAILATMVRWYTPAEVLTMATSTNAELLGPIRPA